MENTGIAPEVKKKIIGILNGLFGHPKIYLYGSRAKGTFRDRSDIDVAVDAGRDLDSSEIGEARSVLEATNIIYKIDVVDLSSAGPEFKEQILTGCIQWQ